MGEIIERNKESQTKVRKICQTGGKQQEERFVNEDIVKIGNGYSILMDGATGLGGPENICGLTSAEWYVQIVSKSLEQNLQNKNRDLKEIIEEAVCCATIAIRQYEAEHRMKFKSYEEPSSSLLIYREIKKEGLKWVQIYVLRRFLCSNKIQRWNNQKNRES